MKNTDISAAITFHQQGNLQEAEDAYRQILLQNPQHADALHLLGVLRRQCGQFETAIELINQAIALNPTNPSYYCNLSEAYYAMGRFKEAVACSQQAIQLRPTYDLAYNNLAIALMSLDRFDQAEHAARDAILHGPQNARAHNTLGQVLRHLNRNREAIAAYQQAVALAPNLAEAQSNLGQALLENFDSDQAELHVKQALQISPKFAEALSNLGNVYREQGDFVEARRCYDEALSINPDLAIVYSNIGQILQEQGVLDDAAGWIQQAIQKEPLNPRFHCDLANLLVEQEWFEQARVRFEIALRSDPDHAESHCGKGRLFQELGQHNDAIDSLQRSIELKPTLVTAYVTLGHIYDNLGRADDAIASFRKAIDLNPRCVGAYTGLAMHHTSEVREQDEAMMWQMLETPNLPDARRAPLSSGIAHLLDKRQTYAEAAKYMATANQLFRTEALQRGKSYDPAQYRSHVDKIIETFDAEYFRRVAGFGDPSQVPVFVFGLPRSGTTLTEQIIASHPAAYGAGELERVGQSLREFAAQYQVDGEAVNERESLDQLRDAVRQADAKGMVGQVAEQHLASLTSMAPGAQKIVDKLPDNYSHLGWIVTMFPNARLVHCRRDLRDIATSCWVTNFKSIRWANDFEHIASRFHDYVRLIEHWRSVLPANMLDFVYEETVADFEPSARKLIDWVGLDWNPACLDFHRTERPVRTASVSQVREPIYQRSAGRWANYQSDLSELFQLLPRT